MKAASLKGRDDDWSAPLPTLKLFPIAAGTKVPLLPGDWRDHATDDQAQIEAWRKAGHNLGCDCEASALAAIDLDGGEIGEATWANLQTEHGAAPATLEHRTPRGGRHLIFRGEVPTTVQRLGPKVDTRGAGGFIVWEGSTSDGYYEVIQEVAPAPLPGWVAAAINARREKHAAAVDTLDLPFNIKRAENYLQRLEPVHEGNGADARTYEVAAALRDLGVSQETSVDLMLEHYRCEPQDGRYEAFLARKIANVWAYAQNDAAAWGLTTEPTERFVGVVLDSSAANYPALAFESLNSLLASTPAPVGEIIGGLVEKHTFTTLAGPGGVHKSRLGLQWGLCVGAGVPIFGRTVEQCSFVFLSCEDPRDEIVRRVHAITKRLGLPRGEGAGFHYLNRQGRPEPMLSVGEGRDPQPTPFGVALVAALKAMPGHKLLLIDGTYNAVRFVGRAKIDEDCVMQAIGWFDALCAVADCTIISLWHPSQAGQERGDASGWSVAWHNRPRARLSLTVVSGIADAFTLKVEKRNHGPKGPPITVHWSDGALLPLSETDGSDWEARFENACVDAALAAAETDQAIQKQRRPPAWVFDDIEKAIGRRPTLNEVRDRLALALRKGLLRYLKGTNDRTAGYYPPDQQRAAELAREAKARQAGT